jgi:hypothetical protein
MFDLCKAEQDLATGESETGEKIDSAMNLTTPILFDRKIGLEESFVSSVKTFIVQWFARVEQP